LQSFRIQVKPHAVHKNLDLFDQQSPDTALSQWKQVSPEDMNVPERVHGLGAVDIGMVRKQ